MVYVHAVNIPEAAAIGEDHKEARAKLGLLHALEAKPAATQRDLARTLGVALGLTNAYLKRAVAKGWVKVRQVPARRYAYYLTPKGFAEKAWLTQQYLSVSLQFFRRARAEYGELMTACHRAGAKRIALAGAGELAEIAQLAAREHGIEVAAVFDPGWNAAAFCGYPVARTLAELARIDAVVLTDQRDPQAAYDGLLAALAPERILAPRFLHVAMRIAESAEAAA